MSRLWRDRLLVGLAPAELTLVRVRGMLRQRIVARRAVPCDPVSGAEPWQGAAVTLGTAAESLRAEPLDVAVVLSNHFVRYAIVPWDNALAGAEEELAYARHCFTKIHGDRAKTWVLRVSEEPAGAPRLASAIDAPLLEAIRDSFPRSGKARLVSVQPYLMAAFNRCRAGVPPDGSWLLIVEAERACVALNAKGAWRAVRNTKGEFSTEQEWVALLERERHRTDGEAADTALVHAIRGTATQWPQSTNWKFKGIALPSRNGYSPLKDERYAMALTAC